MRVVVEGVGVGTQGVVGSCGRCFWVLGAVGVGVRGGELGGSESGLDGAMAVCPPSVRGMVKNVKGAKNAN